MDREFLIERIARCKAQISAYENALDALQVQGVSQYSLTTGQTTQQVTKHDIRGIESMISVALNRLSMLEVRLAGSAVYGRAG